MRSLIAFMLLTFSMLAGCGEEAEGQAYGFQSINSGGIALEVRPGPLRRLAFGPFRPVTPTCGRFLWAQPVPQFQQPITIQPAGNGDCAEAVTRLRGIEQYLRMTDRDLRDLFDSSREHGMILAEIRARVEDIREDDQRDRDLSAIRDMIGRLRESPITLPIQPPLR